MKRSWQQQEQYAFAKALDCSALLAQHQETLSCLMQQGHEKLQQHGDFHRWQTAWGKLPDEIPEYIDLNADCIRLGTPEQLSKKEHNLLYDTLQSLHPWRKGPFSLFGITIDTEWRSNWKWARIAPHIAPLHGRTVLDVGCGSGYHLWRMMGEQARLVIGIDPTMLFAMQFEFIKRYSRENPVFFLPAGIESMPMGSKTFDTVFSMGILYHRRSPIEHLMQLRGLLRSKGELVLETLYTEGDKQQCLLPAGRYAKMCNVWFIPSIPMLGTMLQRAGYHDIHVVHAGITTLDEQRTTDWMHFESLKNFLRADDVSQTCEGYSSPRRVVLLAKA